MLLMVPLSAIIGALGGWASWLAADRLTGGGDARSAPRALPLPLLASLAGGVVLGGAALRSGGDGATVAAVALLAAPLLITLLTDLLARLVYPAVLLPGILVALALAASGRSPGLPGAIVGGVGAAVVTALLVVLARMLWGGAGEVPLGSGEILIAALIGAIFGPDRAPAVLLAGVAAGAVVAALLLLTRRAGREDAIPYGVVLCGAALAALVW